MHRVTRNRPLTSVEVAKDQEIRRKVRRVPPAPDPMEPVTQSKPSFSMSHAKLLPDHSQIASRDSISSFSLGDSSLA